MRKTKHDFMERNCHLSSSSCWCLTCLRYSLLICKLVIRTVFSYFFWGLNETVYWKETGRVPIYSMCSARVSFLSFFFSHGFFFKPTFLSCIPFPIHPELICSQHSSFIKSEPNTHQLCTGPSDGVADLGHKTGLGSYSLLVEIFVTTCWNVFPMSPLPSLPHSVEGQSPRYGIQGPPQSGPNWPDWTPHQSLNAQLLASMSLLARLSFSICRESVCSLTPSSTAPGVRPSRGPHVEVLSFSLHCCQTLLKRFFKYLPSSTRARGYLCASCSSQLDCDCSRKMHLSSQPQEAAWGPHTCSYSVTCLLMDKWKFFTHFV